MKGGIEIKLLYFFFDTVYIFAAVDKDKHHELFGMQFQRKDEQLK